MLYIVIIKKKGSWYIYTLYVLHRTSILYIRIMESSIMRTYKNGSQLGKKEAGVDRVAPLVQGRPFCSHLFVITVISFG